MKLMLLGVTAVISGTILFCADYIVNSIVSVMPDVSVVSGGHYTEYAFCLIIAGIIMLFYNLFRRNE